MNALLQLPALEDLKVYIQNEIEKGIEKALPAAIEKALSDPENPFFIKAVENVLAISDLNILKRLHIHDVLLGLEESDEDNVSIPARIEALEHITIAHEKLIEPNKVKVAIIPRTSLEHKATEFMIHVRDAVTKTGKMFLDSKEQMHFFKYGLPEPLRMGDIQNPRQFKKDVIEKAKSMFPFIDLDKKKNGRRNVRVVYKPENDSNSLKRMDPYIRLKPT
jgi:hypothetical protein